jgi:hypothetical protein
MFRKSFCFDPSLDAGMASCLAATSANMEEEENPIGVG